MPNCDTLDELYCTVGRVGSGVAVLVSDDLQLFEIPSILLPPNHIPGTLLSLRVECQEKVNRDRTSRLMRIQDLLLEKYGQSPKGNGQVNIALIKSSHTVLVFEWLDWESLKKDHFVSGDLRRVEVRLDGRRIPTSISPTENRLRLSGLDPGRDFQVQLRFHSSAGIFSSEVINASTHPLDDLSCVRVLCEGNVALAEEVKSLGMQVVDGLDEYPDVRLSESNKIVSNEGSSIATVTIDWIYACKEAGRMQSVSRFAPTIATETNQDNK